jgi:hypothetical protein
MTERETLENEIRHLVATATDGTTLSNLLFSPPNGLFSQLGVTRELREDIVKSELFRVAQDRIHDLLDIEAECYAQARVEIERQAQARPIRGLAELATTH